MSAVQNRYIATIKDRKQALYSRLEKKGLRERISLGLKKRWKQRGLYTLILPSVVFVFIFCYIPLYGITLAFRIYNPALGPYLSPAAKPLFYNFWFIQDPEFWYVLTNTIKISLVKFVVGFPAPIVLALLINEVSHSIYKRVVQTVTYLPHFISWVIMAGIIYRLFDLEPTSPLNALRALFGLKSIDIMANPDLFLPLVAISNVVKEIGWGTIIYLAAIMNIDPQLYEAAYIDGAGKLQQTRYITLPSMVPIITILLILWVPSILVENLNQIYNLMNPRTLRVANITDIYVLRMGIIQGQYAYATAMGVFFGILSLALTITANKISKKSVGHGIW